MYIVHQYSPISYNIYIGLIFTQYLKKKLQPYKIGVNVEVQNLWPKVRENY